MLIQPSLLQFTITGTILLLFASQTFAQSKKDQLAKTWSYSGIEEFGVVRPPESTMKKDLLEIKTDASFTMIKNGKKSNGTWSLNEKAGIITLTDLKTKKTLNYNLKSVNDKLLVVEYQTPDLVRTKYHYEIKE